MTTTDAGTLAINFDDVRAAQARLAGVINQTPVLRSRTLDAMTGGGPGVATETISVYIYKVTQNDLIWGYVAAIALVIYVLALGKRSREAKA